MSATLISRDLGEKGGMLAARGIATLIVLALAGGLLLAVNGGLFSKQVEVNATVDDIGGALVVGNDVKIRGNIIGRVSSIEPHDDGVRLGLALDPEETEKLSKNVTARILPATIFGTSFVDLVPPEQPHGKLKAGETIKQDDTTETRELQDALDTSYEILTAVEPARLSATLGAFAEALDGRGESIGDTIVTLNDYLVRLEPQLPKVQQDLQLLAQNLNTIAAVAPDLLDALENSFVTTRTIVERQDDLAAILTGGAALTGEANRLVADNHDALVKALTQSRPIVNTMYETRTGLGATFDSLVELATNAQAAIVDPDDGGSKGGYLDTQVDIELVPEPPFYTAADCAVYGPSAYQAYADNCGDAASAEATATDDAALVAEIQGIMAQLESVAAADPNGLGDLMTRGFVGGEGQ
ncbi:MAG: MCE family protein [Aeromicrobium sp.]|uniref:MCE family protein n=1 Tax=Aeromicrobium sp. TaxID=1871063 RepID=UPI0039E48D09